MPPQLPVDVPTSHHRVRRTFATIFGGVGIAFLGLGLISLVLINFVSSPTAAKSTVEIALQQPEVRNYLVEEIVKEIEDKANPVQKLVLAMQRVRHIPSMSTMNLLQRLTSRRLAKQ